MNSLKSRAWVTATLVTTAIYLLWRIFFTLPFGYGAGSMLFALVLLAAELTGMFEQIVHFIGISSRKMPERPKVDEADFPTVDVYIATYNEPVELLYKTVNGCVNMEYPDKSKVAIYLCDDGGRREVRKLAEQFGIHYLERENHEGAKAGNLNHAMSNSDGELIVTFDADMIPMSDFLVATVPYFIPDLEKAYELEVQYGEEKRREREGKIGFIQTPQSFYNMDLFQFNLFSEEYTPNEQDYFYRDIQIGKNATNSVIYGGSNTVISREALEEIGGFVTNVITEDFATGMLIQSKGYQCFAVDEVHASGLSPEDFVSLIKQRKRWARGCIQTGRKLSILFRKGLTIKQKVSYINSISYWYSSIKRAIYMLSPILYSVFGIRVLKATPIELLIFWLPMYLINRETLRRLSGNIRTVRWTNIYETILFPLLLKDVLLESIGISEAKFSVTKKGGTKEHKTNHVNMAIPHMIITIFTIVGILNCFAVIFTTGDVSILFLVFWLLLNCYNLIMAILFMLGRKEYRKSERFVIKVDAVITSTENEIAAVTYDISEGGCSIILKEPEYVSPKESVTITIHEDKYTMTAKASTVQVAEHKDGWKYAFQFEEMDEENYKALLQILHDRVPPLTHVIDMEYGFFEDLRMNIVKRINKKTTYRRKLPRIVMNQSFLTKDGREVFFLNYNYEYVLLKIADKKESDSRLEVCISDGVTMALQLEKELTNKENPADKRYLYKIENAKELLYYQIPTDKVVPDNNQVTKKRHEEKEFNDMEFI